MSEQPQTDRQRDLTQSGQPTKKRTRWIVAAVVMGLVIAIVVTVNRRSFVSPTGKSGEQSEQGEQGEVSDVLEPARLPQGQGPTWTQIDDPTQDGWDTEVFHDKAKKQLAALGHLLANPNEIDITRVADLITDDFACGALLPADLITVFEDQGLKVQRTSTPASSPLASRDSPSGPEDEPSSEARRPYHGADGLVQALRAAADSFSGAKDVRFKFKVFRILDAPGEISIRQYFAISGRTQTGALEQNATWFIRWAPGADGGLPRIRSIHVEDFEQAASRQAGGVLFTDCTASIVGKNTGYSDQFLRGMNHWLERNQDARYFALLGNPGLAVGDVNGDGLDDLYICQEAGLPNRLFIQNPDGSAREESESWGVDWLESSRSALLVDLDNDSDQDLAVAILGGVVVAENDGQGRFHLRDVLASRDDTMSLSAVDYDMDGRLDLYVCAYYQNQGLEVAHNEALPGTAAGIVYHDANDGGKNSLFRNQISVDGSWRFTDVTHDVGLDVNNQRWSLAAAWDDFDNDGDQDLYVANDFGRDNLYRNDPPGSPLTKAAQGGMRRFVDISEAAHIEDSATGMSITCGDYDRDGWMDVYVGNMFSAAGNRITFQSKFKPEAPPEIKRRLQRLARGNTLLRNLGDGTFDDRSAPAGVEMGRWAWGSHFVDVNNDGWEDLVVANGYITTEDTGDL